MGPDPWHELSLSSSDPEVATVDSQGRVRAVSLGSAVITGRAANSDSAHATITVVALPIPHTIAFDPDTATLLPGNATSLHLSGTQARRTAWHELALSSSAPKVATVDSQGRVRAVSPGSAVITARAGHDSAHATITVLRRAPAPTQADTQPTPATPKPPVATGVAATSLPESVSIVRADANAGRVDVHYHLNRDHAVLGFYVEQFPAGSGNCVSEDRHNVSRNNKVIEKGDGDLQFQVPGGARSNAPQLRPQPQRRKKERPGRLTAADILTITSTIAPDWTPLLSRKPVPRERTLRRNSSPTRGVIPVRTNAS